MGGKRNGVMGARDLQMHLARIQSSFTVGREESLLGWLGYLEGNQ